MGPGSGLGERAHSGSGAEDGGPGPWGAGSSWIRSEGRRARALAARARARPYRGRACGGPAHLGPGTDAGALGHGRPARPPAGLLPPAGPCSAFKGSRSRQEPAAGGSGRRWRKGVAGRGWWQGAGAAPAAGPPPPPVCVA